MYVKMNGRGIVYIMATMGIGVILALSVCALSVSLSNSSTLENATEMADGTTRDDDKGEDTAVVVGTRGNGGTNANSVLASNTAKGDVTVYVRVEGQHSTIWKGDVTLTGDFTVTAYNSGNTYTIAADCPLGALDGASKEGGFDYKVNDKWVSWDLYVDSVAGKDAYGWYGWSCRVNNVLPFDYGPAYGWHAGGPELSDGDEILWYWGTWGVLPLRISADETTVYTNEQFTVTVNTLDKDYWHFAGDPWPQINWVPLPNATIHVGNDDYITDMNGKVTMSIEKAGVYEIFAEKLGYIRSDRVKVTVIIPAVIDIDPDTLNLKSKGKWITAYIEVPEGHDVNNIDISTVKILDINGNPVDIPAESRPTEIDDYDSDGIPDLMVKFDRSEVEDNGSPGDASIRVTGELMDGTVFDGCDTIRGINPP